MAIIYVDSNAGGLNDGTSWTDAYTTIQAALTAWTTADVIWWEHDSNEAIAANTTFTCGNATLSDPVIIYSVDSATDTYSPKRGNKGVGGTSNYQLDNTTNWNIFYWNFPCRMYGVSIKCNRQFRNTINTIHSKFIDCDFRSDPTAPASTGEQYLGVAGQTVSVEYYNCDFSGTNDFRWYILAGRVDIYGGSIDYSSDNAGTGLIYIINGGEAHLYGVDISNCTSFDALTHTSSSGRPFEITFDQCKLPSGVSLDGGTSTHNGQKIRFNGCSVDGDLEDSAVFMNSGDIITTNSVYVDASPAHYASSNKFSYEFTPAADCDAADPLFLDFLVGYAETTGSKDISLEIAHDFTSSLTDTDINMVLHYGGTASSAHNDMASNAPIGIYDPIAAGTTLTSSSAAWTGAAGLTKQKLEATITVNRIGPIYARVSLNTYEATKSVHVNSVLDVA